MYPWGLPHLTAWEKKRVQEANELIIFLAKLLGKADEIGSATVLENPLNAYLWVILEHLKALQDMLDVDYAACAVGGARCRRQRLRTRVQELLNLKSECKHIHKSGEWDPVQIGDNEWENPADHGHKVP